MIKITDKITLRQYALKMAIESDKLGMNDTNILNVANKFASFIQGDAELPEFEEEPAQMNIIGFADCCPDIEENEEFESDDPIGLN